MLSIGLDPTWGFGGATQVNDPPTTDVDSVETRKVPIILAPMAGVSTPDMAAAVS